MQSFDNLPILEAGISATTIPKITSLELYMSEMVGHCAGFQIIYHDFTANTFVHFDSESNYCESTTITIGANQYLADI